MEVDPVYFDLYRNAVHEIATLQAQLDLLRTKYPLIHKEITNGHANPE